MLLLQGTARSPCIGTEEVHWEQKNGDLSTRICTWVCRERLAVPVRPNDRLRAKKEFLEDGGFFYFFLFPRIWNVLLQLRHCSLQDMRFSFSK